MNKRKLKKGISTAVIAATILSGISTASVQAINICAKAYSTGAYAVSLGSSSKAYVELSFSDGSETKTAYANVHNISSTSISTSEFPSHGPLGRSIAQAWFDGDIIEDDYWPY